MAENDQKPAGAEKKPRPAENDQKPAGASAPVVGEKYKQYTRYQLTVLTLMDSGGGKFVAYEATIDCVGKKQGIANTNIRVEPARVAIMNQTWHSTKHILIEDGQELPVKIMRRPNGNSNINRGWDDEFIYAKK